MTDPEAQELAAAPAGPADPGPGTVLAELPCPRCGYGLFGRSLDQACPECGKPIRDAVPRGEHVRFFSVQPARSNPVFIMDRITSITASTMSTVLVLIVLSGLISHRWELWFFSSLLLIQAIALIVAVDHGNRRKSKSFVVMLGDDEIWYTMGPAGTGKMRLSDIRAIRQGDGIGIAVIMVRTLNQFDVPCTIEGYELLVDALKQRVGIRPISWINWFLSDVVYGFSLLMLFLLSVPALYGLLLWTDKEKLISLALYYAVMMFVNGYIACVPLRAIEFKRIAASIWPWAVMFIIAMVRIVALH